MLESVLERKNASFKIKITVKTVVSAAIIALAATYTYRFRRKRRSALAPYVFARVARRLSARLAMGVGSGASVADSKLFNNARNG